MIRISTSLGTVTLAALLASAASAQAQKPESILPASPAKQQSVDEAFGDMRTQSGEVVQEIPSIEGEWTVAQANKLLAFIPTVKAEGLRPADYQSTALAAAIAAGEGPELTRLASEIFVWLVEDLRDGRTPMESRRQWFVVDPDADRMPSGTLLQNALQSGDIAGTLRGLNPVNPDYARLRGEVVTLPETKTTFSRLIPRSGRKPCIAARIA